MNLSIKVCGFEIVGISTDAKADEKLTAEELRSEVASTSAGPVHMEMGFKPNTPPLRHSLDRWEPDQWETST